VYMPLWSRFFIPKFGIQKAVLSPLKSWMSFTEEEEEDDEEEAPKESARAGTEQARASSGVEAQRTRHETDDTHEEEGDDSSSESEEDDERDSEQPGPSVPARAATVPPLQQPSPVGHHHGWLAGSWDS
jgi:hypothetical protein